MRRVCVRAEGWPTDSSSDGGGGGGDGDDDDDDDGDGDSGVLVKNLLLLA